MSFDRLRRDWPSLLIGLVIAVLGSLGVVELIDDDGDGRPDYVQIPVPQAGPDAVVQADRDNELESDEQHEAREGTQAAGAPVAQAPVIITPDVHEDARDETPPGVPLEQAKAGLQDKSAEGLRPRAPPAGAQGYTCPSRPVDNYSSRNGQRVLLFVLHFTVSSPGSIDAIRRLFNTRSFGASSHLGLELSGKCQRWVPFGAKAWTQGNFNGRAESVEIVTRDLSRAQWLAAPIIRRGILASIVRDRLRANGLPLRLVDPRGCGVGEAGYTDHDRLECGNSHYDVGRNFPFDVLTGQIRRGVVRAPSSSARRQCQRIRRYRKKARRHGGLNGTEKLKNKRLRTNLDRHGYRCLATKVVRK